MKNLFLTISLFSSVFLLFACEKNDTIQNKGLDTLVKDKKFHNDIKSKEKVFDPEYVHVVYFWLKNPANQDDKRIFEESLRKFLNASLYAKTHFIGYPPIATRDVVDDSFTYNLVLTFTSASDQEAYQNEPAHKTFIEESSKLWNKVVVYDATSISE